MVKVLFKDIFRFEKKSKIKAGDGFLLGEGKFPFYTSSNVLTKSIDEYQFDKESLIFGTGGLASIHFCNEKFSVSTDCFVTQPFDTGKVFTKYVYYYLSGNIHILENGFKGAGLKHISKDYLQNIEIPLPSLSKQKAIAEKLDKAQEIIRYNEEIIAQYDALTQSLFLDMFGDPVKNEKGWEKVKLGNYFKDGVKCGPFGSALKKDEFVECGIPVWNMDNIINYDFVDIPKLFVDSFKYDELSNYKVNNGDIIISRAGTVGKMCIVDTKYDKSLLSTNLIRLSLDELKINPLYFVLGMKFFSNRIGKLKTGGENAFTHMNTGVLTNLLLQTPPIELQNQFAERVAAIEAQKQLAQESLAKSQDLFNSLLQESFKN